jgi:hypothetical protein
VSSRWIAGVVGRSRRLKCVRGDSVARFQSLSGRKRSVVESSCEEEDWRVRAVWEDAVKLYYSVRSCGFPVS